MLRNHLRTAAGTYMEPLSADHLDDLWSFAKAAPESFTYLRYGPFEKRKHLATLIDDLSARADQPFWAVLGKAGLA